MMKKVKEDVVMVSWISVNHQAAPLLTAIEDPQSPFRGKVKKLFLCWRKAGGEDGRRERDALDKTKKALKTELEPICPEIVDLPWDTQSSPTDHAAIRKFAENALVQIRDQNPTEHIVIHLSPGTPSMHAVWLLLGSTGLIEGKLTLIQTSDERAKKAGQPSVKKIDLNLETWLKRFRSSKPSSATVDDDGVLIDPAKVKSPKLKEALEKLNEWAELRVPVLLVGERGTGKTTLAHYLRTMSPFQKLDSRNWPIVVCGQFRANTQLARSELFGHVKGAFTDAKEDRKGLLEQADGDSLFFDEIADIDQDTQRLLMSAIEGKGFSRLGDSAVKQSTFRFISATNRPLDVLKTECLDPDFYDRIAMFILTVPPLRQCKEDIPTIWKSVLARAGNDLDIDREEWNGFQEHPGLLKLISEAQLPGNIRDLQRMAYHVLAGTHAGKPEKDIVSVASQCLSEGVSSATPTLPSTPEIGDFNEIDGGLQQWLDDRERAWLQMAMKTSGGNKSKAADLVGMKRKTFEHHWKRLK